MNYPKFCLFQSSTNFEAIRRGSLSLSDWLNWMSQPLVVPGARANQNTRSNLKMAGEKASMAHYPSQARPLPSLISKLPFLQLPPSLLSLLHPLSFFLLYPLFLLFVLVSYLFSVFFTRGIKHLNHHLLRKCGGKLSIWFTLYSISHLIITNRRWLEEHGWTVSPSLLLGLPSSTSC